MTMNNDDKGVAERVVSGEATFFGSKTETRAQRSPKEEEIPGQAGNDEK